jgi:hypothetical protein
MLADLPHYPCMAADSSFLGLVPVGLTYVDRRLLLGYAPLKTRVDQEDICNIDEGFDAICYDLPV